MANNSMVVVWENFVHFPLASDRAILRKYAVQLERQCEEKSPTQPRTTQPSISCVFLDSHPQGFVLAFSKAHGSPGLAGCWQTGEGGNLSEEGGEEREAIKGEGWNKLLIHLRAGRVKEPETCCHSDLGIWGIDSQSQITGWVVSLSFSHPSVKRKH